MIVSRKVLVLDQLKKNLAREMRWNLERMNGTHIKR